MPENDKVDITPKVGYLAVLSKINYRPWYAIAEFVDNSVQSYIENKIDLKKIHGRNFTLKIDIDISSSKIEISDNAAGIQEKNFERAFRAAAPPERKDGLSEFGMGMKTAACWFSPKWEVLTKPLGEKDAKLVKFDIDKIVRDEIEELDISRSAENKNKHHTTVTLYSIRKNRRPKTATVTKIKECLASMYRAYIDAGEIIIRYNEEKLKYSLPKILNSPDVRDIENHVKNIKSIQWRKNIKFSFGEKNQYSVSGFVALREEFNRKYAGLSLFRRKRLIVGMDDEGYRPQKICSSPETRLYARVFGELHFSKNMPVTHTKDDFDWSLEEQEKFLIQLKDIIDTDQFPLLAQGRKYKVDRQSAELRPATIKGHDNSLKHLGETLSILSDPSLEKLIDLPRNLPPSDSKVLKKTRKVNFDNNQWIIHSELDPNPDETKWLLVSQKGVKNKEITIRISLNHPFTSAFFGDTPEEIEGMIRLANYLALAEIISKERGNPKASYIRQYLNKILSQQPPADRE